MNQSNHESQMKAVDNSTVVEKVIKQITDSIKSGGYQLGEKLPNEFELMQQLNISRNSLREAMKVLKTMGVVEIIRGHGTYICKEINPGIFDSMIYSMIMEASTSDEILELRQMLDVNVMTAAMYKATPENIDQLQAIVNEMRKLFDNGDIHTAVEKDIEFHLYMLECCHNKFLTRIVSGVYQLFEPSMENNVRSSTEFAKADKHHQAMIDCLRNKEENKIKEIVSASLSSWKNKLKG